jgi:putative CocE/NonD family hydrolase
MPELRIFRGSRRRGIAALVAMVLAGIVVSACRAERPPAGTASRAEGAAPAAGGPSPAVPYGGSAPAAFFPNLTVEKNVPVPMRDGIVLRADVYRPETPGKYPTLVYRTPYGKDDLLDSGSEPTIGRAAHAGFAVVVQDVRGRYHSDGEFRPYHQEGKDGFDTIEWAAVQPWSNGRVGTFGLSYPGAVQWLAAMEAPPHLLAIFPAMTFATGRHFFFFGGAFNHDWMRWIEMYIAPDVRLRKGLPGATTEKEAAAGWSRLKWQWEYFLPIRDFPVLKEVAPWYYDWLAHPDDSEYWRFADVVAAHSKIAVPALNFSAWYDSNYGPLGATANWSGMRRNGATEVARRGQRLILGPWEHGDPSESETKVGELEFGPSMTLDYYGLVIRWHDRWLKGIRNGIDEGPPVRLFVMGENRWRDENEWPLARTVYTPYYLRSGGRANTASGDGRLAMVPPAGGAGAVGAAPATEPPDRYLYDPGRPVVIENFEVMGPYDRSKLQSRQDVLVYTTEALLEDVEVTGPITVHLWAASSAVDTDFCVMLYDVHPDGRAYNLMPNEAGVVRARYRASESAPTLLTPNEPEEFVIDQMVTSNVFKRGHRIRLDVTSSRFPSFDRNPNTGEPFGTSSRMTAARQTVLHDAAHPSRVILPIIPRAGDR